jgi:hypothetical protein
MSNDMTSQQGWTKVWSLIQKALALGQMGGRAFRAALNFLSIENAAGLPVAQTVTFTQAMTSRVSGKFLVTGTISGLLSAVDLPLVVTLTRGGLQMGPSFLTTGGHVTPDTGATLTWADNTGQAVGTTVTYGVSASTSGGNTFNVAAAKASLTMVELPS